MATPGSENLVQCRSKLETQVWGGIRGLIYSEDGTPKQLREFYHTHAEEYDQVSLYGGRVEGCRVLTTALAEWIPNKDARILDIGAGTGFAGKELRKLGYNNIDALEPSDKMLEIAKSQNIYKEYIVDFVTPAKKTQIKNGAYDAIYMMSIMVPCHMNLDCLPEVMRMTKKGGVIVFNISDKHREKHADFHDAKVEKTLQAFLDNGQWAKWDKLRGPYNQEEDCNIYRVVLA